VRNPEVSHRIAEAMYLARPVDLETRARLVRAAQRATSYARLPRWVKTFVRDAERSAR
jgi:hypothetical protein